jgi:acetylornithine/succinyldiaminopimelate/putrescine aminotransferase
VIVPSPKFQVSSSKQPINFLQLLRKKCDEVGALLIFDEVQTGMGRTGKMFAFEHYGIVPDILCLAKAFGGGMPLGAFISSKEIMSTLSHDPVLGHITTFGGHPVCCAASLAALQIIASPRLTPSPSPKGEGRKLPHEKGVKYKGELFKKLLVHPRIKEVRGEGLLLAVQFSSEEKNKKIIARCIENGVVVDWFLFRSDAMRIAPPLTISEKEIKWACKMILKSIEE